MIFSKDFLALSKVSKTFCNSCFSATKEVLISLLEVFVLTFVVIWLLEPPNWYAFICELSTVAVFSPELGKYGVLVVTFVVVVLTNEAVFSVSAAGSVTGPIKGNVSKDWEDVANLLASTVFNIEFVSTFCKFEVISIPAFVDWKAFAVSKAEVFSWDEPVAKAFTSNPCALLSKVVVVVVVVVLVSLNVVCAFASNDWKAWVVVVPSKPLELLVEKMFVSITSAEFLASTEGI